MVLFLTIPDLPITCQNHAVAGRYTVLLWSQSAGMTLKWFAAKFYPDVPELEAAFQQMDAEARADSAGLRWADDAATPYGGCAPGI